MSWIRSSLFNQLLVIIVGGCALILAAALYYYSNVTAGIDSYRRLIEQEVSHRHEVALVLSDFKVQVQEWKNVLLRGHDEEQRKKYWAQFLAQEEKVQKGALTLATHLGTTEAARKLENFAREHSQMGHKYRQGLDAFIQAGFDHRAGDLAVKGIDRAPTELLDQAIALIGDNVAKSAHNTEKEVDNASGMAAALLFGAIAVFITLSLWLINAGIVVPSQQIINTIEHLSRGNLQAGIRMVRADELGRLAKAAEVLREFLRGMAEEMQRSSAQLLDVSQRVTAATSGIAEHTGHSNDRILLITTAMEEMSATSSEVARHAQQAAGVANDANLAANAGKVAMQKAQDVIDKLSSQIGSSMRTVTKLDTDTRNVGSVLSVIKAIAEQTNLLALNAAIEAARAGEQGRGFAVVADEVRTLAQRTQQSTAEIQGIIENVQAGARDTVQVMEMSQQISDHSVDIFRDASGQLNQITDAIGDLSGINAQVATASSQQTTVAHDIARNIADVAEGTEETAQAASGMHEIVSMLTQMVNRSESLTKRFTI